MRSAWEKGFFSNKTIIKAQISYLTRAGRNTPIRRKITIKINATAKNVRTSGHQLIATRANVDMIWSSTWIKFKIKFAKNIYIHYEATHYYQWHDKVETFDESNLLNKNKERKDQDGQSKSRKADIV